MNCFIPTSHITTIRRGGSPYGEVVGSFEMGIATKKSAVTMAGRERLMDVVLNKAGNKANRVWQWKWHNNRELHLSWHCDSPVKYCYLAAQAGTPNASLLASFTPQPLAPRADGLPSPPSSLKVFPDGQWLFDDIVISTLILERKRLTPDPRRLFN
ncbi:uncharacterized protein LAESUDRAFT_725396 [Laetiporus sulphureus 93-53]|uniref:DUF6593 domain-containing protein n=1 Tax=Laetiporus sulphureus 93-53 TaxID=1314785 RepID=A0A165EH84_9APHY|nr:uncharacterized protein LAESUDRAFT_725396 [Laetiporus sulphureus 93-53]KZT07049.1 hypothetical protein LAESUDRAFT_725396 [Laetiporus sulphureus 93-53]